MQQKMQNTAFMREVIVGRIDSQSGVRREMERRRTTLIESATQLRSVSAVSVAAVESELSSTQIELTNVQARISSLQDLLSQETIPPHSIARVLLDELSDELNQDEVHQLVLALLDLVTKSETREVEQPAIHTLGIVDETVKIERVDGPTPQPDLVEVTKATVAQQSDSLKPKQVIFTIDQLSYYETISPITWSSLALDTSATEQTVSQRFLRLYQLLGIKYSGRGWMLERLPLLAQRVTTEHLKALAIRDLNDKIFIETGLALLRIYDLTVASGHLHREAPNFVSKAKSMIAATINCTKESMRKLNIDPDTALAPQIYAALLAQDQQMKAKTHADTVAHKAAPVTESTIQYPDVTLFQAMQVPGDVLGWIQKNGLRVEEFRIKKINAEIVTKINFLVAYLRGEIQSFEISNVKFYKSEIDGHKYLQVDHGRSDFRIMFRLHDSDGEHSLNDGIVIRKSEQETFFKRNAK